MDGYVEDARRSFSFLVYFFSHVLAREAACFVGAVWLQLDVECPSFRDVALTNMWCKAGDVSDEEWADNFATLFQILQPREPLVENKPEREVKESVVHIIPYFIVKELLSNKKTAFRRLYFFKF